MKCLLFASWKPYTTHPLAGYVHQIIGRPRVVVRAHLDFTSRSSSEPSVIWKCRAATRKLKAASLVSMTHCLDMLVDHLSPRQLHAFSLLHSGILQRWARYLGPCETGLHILADTSNAESLGSLHMHECLTQVLTRTVARFTKSRLISLRASFKYIQILPHKLQRLERLVFVRSLLYLHSSPERAPCSSFCEFEALLLQVDSKWFQTTTSLIRKDAFSANISRPSFHKNWSLIGGEKLPCWYWHNRAMAMSVKSCIEVHWLDLVSGQGSSSASKTCPRLAWACTWERVTCVTASRLKMALRSEEKIAGCNRSGQRSEANRFRSDRRFCCFELTKFESICLPGTPKNHVFLVIRLRLFFLSLRRCILYRQMWPCMFFFNMIRTPFLRQNVEKLWLCYAFGFGTNRLGLTIFFYPLRAFLINDPKKLSFTRFSHNDKKNMGFWVSRRGNSKATEYLGGALSWNASSGLPEEHLLFEHLFHFHDVSMHLGGLNPLMRCHEQRKVRNLTAPFKARTALRLPHRHVPRRSAYQEGAVAASNAPTSLAGIPSL